MAVRRRVALGYWIGFWTLVLIVYPVATFAPRVGTWHILPGVTVRTGAGTAIWVLGGAQLLRYVGPFYWHAWHQLPPAWWRWAVAGGLLLMVVGLGGAGLVAFLHEQLGDVLGIRLYMSGLSLSGIGLALFAAGSASMGHALGHAIQRQLREARDRALGPTTPPAP
jgi:hypothetical protein